MKLKGSLNKRKKLRESKKFLKKKKKTRIGIYGPNGY